MYNRILLIPLILLICCCNLLFGQAPNTVFNLKQMLPTSPEAASIGRFGEIPVGPYTGTADISIPLYTIKEAGLEIPIVLSYHSSGVKVEDEASNVGLGWSLEPGGAIIQIVNGRSIEPDLLHQISESGYLYLKQQGITGAYFERAMIGFNGYFPCVFSSGNTDNNATLQALSQGWGQPDIYQYNFAGLSGKFYINPETSQIVMLDKKTHIKFQRASSDAMTATTLDGHKFYFDVVETTNGGVYSEYVGKTLKLSKIELNNGKAITFGYQAAYYLGFIYNETFRTDYPANKSDGYTNKVEPHWDNALHYIQMLSSITTDKIAVNFNLESREDLYSDRPETIQTAKRIKSVDIVDVVSGKKIKSYNLSYSYFASSSVGGSYLTKRPGSSDYPYQDVISKRLKLLSIQEVGYNPAQLPVLNPPYSFNYNESITLPFKTSFARDYWGFYNGQNNTKLAPDLSFFYFSDDPIYQTMPSSVIDNMQGANRAPDSTKMQAGILKRVTYPTGGFSEFDYEPHTFKNHIYPDVERITAASKLAEVADRNLSTDVKTKTFTLTQTQTIKFYTFITRGLNSAITFYDLQPSTITLTKTIGGVTTTIKTWQMFISDKAEFDASGGFFERDESITLPYQAGAQYTITTYLPDVLGAQPTIGPASATSHFSYYLPAESYTNSYGGGLRIKAVRNYSATSAIATKKIYKYTDTVNVTSGVLMSPYKPLYNRIVYGVITIPNGDGTFNRLGSDARVWYVSPESAIPFSNAAGGNIVGYSRVEESEVAGDGSLNGKHVYSYYNTESDSHVDVPDNPNLMNGLIKEEEVFANSSNTPLIETNYSWELKESSLFSGYKSVSTFVGDAPDCNALTFDPNFWGQIVPWRILYYPINSAWYVMGGKSVVERFNGKALATAHVYTYNGLGQLSKEIVNTSENQTMFSTYFYPYDVYPTGTPIENSLYTAGLLNSVLSAHSQKNGHVTSDTYITYANFNGQLTQSKIEQSVNGNALYTQFTFDDYGPNKTLRQVTEKGIKPISLLWNDNNSYIIAQSENSAIADIAYSSFEPTQNGNWTIPSANRYSGGLSGNKAYALSNGTISKIGLTSSKTYIVSYWTMNSTPYTIAGTITGYPVKGYSTNGWTYYEHCITGQTSVSISGTGNIDEVRLYPLNAQMNTYTYDTTLGVTSTIDAKSNISYYEYDPFLRLENIKDKDGNILKHTGYHYQNQ
jgi:hypothetical protein